MRSSCKGEEKIFPTLALHPARSTSIKYANKPKTKQKTAEVTWIFLLLLSRFSVLLACLVNLVLRAGFSANVGNILTLPLREKWIHRKSVPFYGYRKSIKEKQSAIKF